MSKIKDIITKINLNTITLDDVELNSFPILVYRDEDLIGVIATNTNSWIMSTTEENDDFTELSYLMQCYPNYTFKAITNA